MLGLATGGCSKSVPSDARGPATTNQEAQGAIPGPGNREAVTVVPNLASNLPLLARTNGPALAGRSDSEAVRPVAELARQFRASTNFDDRFEALLSIGEVGTAEAVTALEGLFREEQDKDVRVELINALIGITGAKDERLRFLELGTRADQPREVREAAMDGLVDLEDARALPVLRSLFSDSDPNVRNLARQLHELATQQVPSQNP
jgi:HEAT repeat protein